MNQTTITKVKYCTKCEKWKPLSVFYKNKATRDGLQCCCKMCRDTNYRRYRQTEKGKRARAKADKKYHQTHRTKRLKYSKEYRQAHKIEYVKRDKKYRCTIKGCLYKQFQSMKDRCTNPNYHGYKYYGGRGIKCKFSRDGFANYVINELKINTQGLCVHRIDNDKHYERGNIEFLTPKKHKRLHDEKSNN